MILCVLPITGQEIPEGITYIKASDEANEKAVKHLTEIFLLRLRHNSPQGYCLRSILLAGISRK